MRIIDTAMEAFRFKDTIFLKEDSSLQLKYDALNKLTNEYSIDYPNKEALLSELYKIKKGLSGEKAIAYQLKKANIGMYVLHDISLKYEDLSAQIDYVVITPVFTYFIECKNLSGNITVNEKGDFIREYMIDGQTVRKGMYSPLRQVEAQREVVRKIWEDKISNIKKFFAAKSFNNYQRVLVVAANDDTILDTSKAPQNIKYKVIRADALVKQIQYEIDHRNKDDIRSSQKEMEEIAKSYLNISVKDETDYYNYYKEKYFKEIIDNELRERLIEFRKNRSNQMNIPAYYVFTNEELDKLIETKPKTIDELKQTNILSQIKISTHGELIIKEINKNND